MIVWKFHRKEPMGFSAWTGIVADVETVIGLNLFRTELPFWGQITFT